jgi:hypothetical protein
MAGVGPIENRAAERRSIDGLSLTWSEPAATRRRGRRPRPVRGVDISEVGLGVRAPRGGPAPATEVVLWCGVHEFTAVVRRCEPINEHEWRYGLELVAVAEATLSKLLFYAESAPRGQLEDAWGRAARRHPRRRPGPPTG